MAAQNLAKNARRYRQHLNFDLDVRSNISTKLLIKVRGMKLRDRQTDGRRDRQTDGRRDRQTDGRSKGLTDGRSKGQTDGRSEGQTDGRSEGLTDRSI